MPLYEYFCPVCKMDFKLFHSVDTSGLTCENCFSVLEKKIGNSFIITNENSAGKRISNAIENAKDNLQTTIEEMKRLKT